MHDWFKGYLNNREQFVSYNDVLMETKQISHEALQGSILGHLLFILYVMTSQASDILFSIYFLHIQLYWREGYSYKNIITILNNELIKIDPWLQVATITVF